MAKKSHKRKKIGAECPVPQKAARAEGDESLEGRRVYARNINRLLSNCSLVIIRGPIGCGKTFSAVEAAHLSQTPLKIIHINEDFDVKALIGAYKCTDIPGEFVWTPSFFAKCLQEECYILLEELDSGSPDLVAAILTLCEKREYTLYTGERRFLHKNCRILATVTSGRDANLSLIRDHPFFVEVRPFSSAELNFICAKRFPAMESVHQRTLKIFGMASQFIAGKCPSDRQLNSKDLFRLCRRLNAFCDFSSNISLFGEMSDLWLMHLSDPKRRLEIAAEIGGELSLSKEQINTLLNVHKPEIVADDSSVKIGRANLSRKRDLSTHIHSFGLTRECCQLMARIAASVSAGDEAVLLAGETGVGKTSVVQLLADYCGVTLTVVNVSQDSEFSDLIGGFKPTPVMNLLRPLVDDYVRIFRRTFDEAKNQKFLSCIDNCLANERVEDLLKLVIESGARSAQLKISVEWANVVVRAKRLLHYVQSSSCAFPFTYVAGIVTKATELGHWLLIDEINLAPPECLDSIMQVISDTQSATKVHQNFRLFACMNPATDVGKRFLSVNVRSRFTEFFVGEPTEREQLEIIIKNYLPQIDLSFLNMIWNFYQEVHALFPRKYSLRTLCRALKIIANNSKGNFKREKNLFALGFSISFTSNLNIEEQLQLGATIQKNFGKVSNLRINTPSASEKDLYVEVEGSYIKKGESVAKSDSRFIFTPSVKANLAFLASIVANGQFPILLEGETSAGKTSMIQHLAKVTGNRVYRINNHEHTDIQEYIGSYAPNASGHIEFVEGVLLKAVRNGDWIILDELNLAPSIVLEALNRLLDDNREIYVPELNTTVVAHSRFRLFATQNPAGYYAGRKRLSAAFLNRFVIVKYDHLPFDELPKIVEGRCGVAPSVAEKMVEVLVELKARRSVYGIFSFSSGLMTLRDLFRWATRVSKTVQADFDWRQIAAEQGYFVLASRCRNTEDEKMVVDVLEKCLKRKIDVDALFGENSKYMPNILSRADISQIVLTYSMRRMAVLCAEAWKFNEAVLLVGETGCGKTTVAHLLGSLLSINCHERTETSDFLGSIRPTSDGKFQWNDGIVVRAMKTGGKLLIDEISLAPDSVLERLNSLLETDRTMLLTDGVAESETIVAHADFQVIGTMNPGDDHGKKELSKALRNRFLEVWCIGEHKANEVQKIIEKRLCSSSSIDDNLVRGVSECFVRFFEHFRAKYLRIFTTLLTIRDLINMSELFCGCLAMGISVPDAISHSISANLFDAFGVVPSRISYDREKIIDECVAELKSTLADLQLGIPQSLQSTIVVEVVANGLKVGPFIIPQGLLTMKPSNFAFDASTSQKNVLCVARGMVSTKPIMLEGSPGAGKSSLIVALAEVTGNPLVRLNLSEQTDLSDLFGGDVPNVTEDGKTSFSWRDGPVLKAIKDGAWILLDEMNLASQSVLEGLNSCFDFRKNLYISELNKTFEIQSTKCRFFACQNPRSQGGDRKSLPKSFLNRFTSIYISELSDADFLYILGKLYGNVLSEQVLSSMVLVNRRVLNLSLREGGPYEFNLRDLLRWTCAVQKYGITFGYNLIYVSRIRNERDIKELHKILQDVFPSETSMPETIEVFENEIRVSDLSIQIDRSFFNDATFARQCVSLISFAKSLRKLSSCVDLNWLTLLVGDFSNGLRLSVEMLANLARRKLHVLRLTSETDSLELLGSYEQIIDDTEYCNKRKDCFSTLKDIVKNDDKVSRSLLNQAANSSTAAELLSVVQQALVLYPCAELEKMSALLSTMGSTSFRWIDSEFVNAYKHGHWILVQDVNCCSAAVLDCLNSCLEDGGNLVLPEHSVESIVEKHPDFRVFFTMDPRNGSLSRAMRNRSVELYFGNGKFWIDSLASFFNAPFTNENVKEDVLNWVSATSLGVSLKAKALDFSTPTDLFGDLHLCVEMFFKEMTDSARISQLFQYNGVEFVDQSFGNALTQFCVCYPFSTAGNYETFTTGFMEVVEASKVDDSCISRLTSSLSGVFSIVYGLLGKNFNLRNVSDFNADDTQLIPWINDDVRDIVISLQAFTTSFDVSSYRENLYSFLNSSFLTVLASQFWDIFGYSISPDWSYLKDFNQSTIHLQWLRNSFWKLSFMSEDIGSVVDNKLRAIGNRFYLKNFSNCSKFSLVELACLIGSSIALLKALTPTKNDADVNAVLAGDLNLKCDLEKLRITVALFRCLKRFLFSITDKCDEAFFENLKFPILRLLWKFNHGIVEEDGTAFTVFRPTDQAFNQLSHFLVEFMALVSNFDDSVLKGDVVNALKSGEAVANSKLLLLSSQIESMLTSAKMFHKTVTKKFCGFPDVIFPYTAVVNILTIGLNAFVDRISFMRTSTELFEKHQFPKICGGVWNSTNSEAIIGWSIGENSTLSLRYQYQLVNWQISKAHNSKLKECVEWIFKNWRIRYESTVEKQAEMFVYKSRAVSDETNAENDDIPDEDRIEFDTYFPNYGEVELDEASESKDTRNLTAFNDNYISDAEIVALLHKVAKVSTAENTENFPYFSLMKLFQELQLYDFVSEADRDFLKYEHLIYLHEADKLSFRIKEKERDHVLNVYVENDYGEIARCVSAIEMLKAKINNFYEEFPENQVLAGILNTISMFLKLPATMPLMKLTALLEKVLVEADQWQQLADRAHSVKVETLALQQILVDWRRLEVLCWADIVERIQRECQHSAVIGAYPLFDAFQSLFGGGDFGDVQERENKLILMLIEWIQNASLIDFEVRLFTGELLSRFVDFHGEKAIRRFSPHFSKRLCLVVNYFRIFAATVNERFSVAKKDVEEKLKNFVEIFKYNDLNLWSVKQSTQKVHGQLFRIIKKFKDTGREPVSGILFDAPLAIPAISFSNVDSISRGIVTGELFSKLELAVNKMSHLLAKFVDVDALVDLKDMAEDLFTMLKSDIVYAGSDEEKEKQQGRALSERQKGFARLVKSLAGIGLASRRGLQVNSEALTVSSLSSADLDALTDSSELSLLIRHSVSSRNVFLKKNAGLRLVIQDHIRKQVPVQYFSHLRGISEFGLFWMLNAVQYLLDDLCRSTEQFRRMSGDLTVLADNAKESYSLKHSSISLILSNNEAQFAQMQTALELLGKVLLACPDGGESATNVDANLTRLVQEIAKNPLSALTKSNQEYQKLFECVRLANEAIKRVRHQHSSVLKPSFNGFWKATEVTSYKDIVLFELGQLQNLLLPTISQYFDKESLELNVACFELTNRTNEIHLHNPISAQIDFNDYTQILLKIQQIYKGVSGKFDTFSNSTKLLDRVKELIELTCRVDLKTVFETFAAFLSHCKDSLPCSNEDLQNAQILCAGFCAFLDKILQNLTGFLQNFSLCYLHFESVAFHIISNGFVNPIPKTDGESGDAKEGGDASAGENCGMGDADNADGAKDATDVSNQMDNMGQVEGLKEDESKNEQGENEKPEESENPIEMEDDFAGGLEDLDGEEVDENENKGENDKADDLEDKIDWEKGDVEQPEERQLDPELWDKPLEQEAPEVVDEDDAKGADKETEEVVAKDDKSAPTDKEDINDAKETDEQDENETTEIEPASEMEENFENLDGDEAGENDGEENNADDAEEQNNGESEEMEVDENEKPEEDDEKANPNSAQNRTYETNVTESADAENTEGTEPGSGDLEKDRQDDNATKDDKLDNKKEELDEKAKKSKQHGDLGNEEELTEEQSKVQNTDEKDQKPTAEIADENENIETFEQIDTPKIDDEEMMENFDPDGEDTFAPQNDQNQQTQAKHIVQKATMEEAAKTRELYQRLDRTGEKECHRTPEEPEILVDDEKESGILQFERYDGRDEDVIVISENINLLEPFQLASSVGRMEDLTNSEQDSNKTQSLEVRWSNISDSVSQLASILAENLRIIIEPTVASRLQGDYRTGKRLNVRRLISYVASDYRKDRIWMRRTKKVKRNYHICIAVDDSASMKDNLMTTMTCHSLCLIEKALRQLEVGKLMICKFGKDVKVLSDFCADNAADTALGARLMSELTFCQDKTDLANLLTVAGDKFADVQNGASSSAAQNADQMLIVLSDGRGVLADGVEKLKCALKRLEFDRVTVLFLIIDNGGKSIMDIKVVSYQSDGNVKLTPYMELFPFPFYAIINGISQLPSAISAAIQQWFEFTSR